MNFNCSQVIADSACVKISFVHGKHLLIS
nr:unnamed protein product [Callosobruchus chinensis]CAH7765110.1 unnamed protein product [Callosobruchus chinensis]